MFVSSVYLLIILAARCAAYPVFDSSAYEKHLIILIGGIAVLCAWTSYKHFNIHFNLSLLNLTSIEYLTLPAFISLNWCQRYGVNWSRISNYDKGWRQNIIMVLGEPAATWFLPWVAPRSPWGPLPVTCQFAPPVMCSLLARRPGFF